MADAARHWAAEGITLKPNGRGARISQYRVDLGRLADDFHAATADLKRQLPRIPLPDTSEDFGKFVEAGEHLLELHIRYEEQPEYPLGEETVLGDDGDPEFYRVKKLSWGTPDKSQIVVNDNITLTGIPDEAHEYVLGSRSALEWILDRYQVKTDKASGIINDPNDWGLEHGNPRYIVELIKKVTHVSVETVKIVKSLPKLTLKK